MSYSGPGQVLSHLDEGHLLGRGAELDRLYSVATASQAPIDQRKSSRASRAVLMVLGPPRVGKTEILLKTFDRLFTEGGQVVPVYFCFRSYDLDPERMAREMLSSFLAEFIAFRRRDPRFLITAGVPLASVSRGAPAEDHLWMRQLVDSFEAASRSGDVSSLMASALGAPTVAASNTGLAPFVMLDNFHVLAGAGPQLLSGVYRALVAGEGLPRSASYALSGLRRPILDMMPADDELFGSLEFFRVEPLGDEPLERAIRSMARSRAVELSDSTAELMVQQLNRDLFYIRALLDGASAAGASLKTFMEFERVYTEEVLTGRLGSYFDAVLRELAPDLRWRRAVLECLRVAVDADGPVPFDAVIEPMRIHGPGAEEMLTRLHGRELLEVSYGFVKPTPDPVFADYVRATYRTQIAGLRRPVVGDHLLGERLRQAYRLMTSRHNRAVEAQLVDVLSRFDFQPAPAGLFDEAAFDARYRGHSRVQIRRLLGEEQEKIRLPQIVSVDDLGSSEEAGISWRLFAASGFDGGIYSEANEVLWLIALLRSKAPLDLETLNRLDQRLDSGAARTQQWKGAVPRLVRWYVSNEGFSGIASERLSASQSYRSSYLQLDLLQDHLINLGAGPLDRRPASEFELVIPIESDAELIAARTVEQIARAADFDQEAINQIKTALIEACINAAEHSDSPDRKIYQRFAIDDDRLIITVSNKGKTLGSPNGVAAPAAVASAKGARGRGLQIIRALMDEVRFDRTDDGTSLVMTKFLKRPEQQ